MPDQSPAATSSSNDVQLSPIAMATKFLVGQPFNNVLTAALFFCVAFAMYSGTPVLLSEVKREVQEQRLLHKAEQDAERQSRDEERRQDAAIINQITTDFREALKEQIVAAEKRDERQHQHCLELMERRKAGQPMPDPARPIPTAKFAPK